MHYKYNVHEKQKKDLVERIEKLEKDSHPPIGLCEFDGFKELVERIEKLEKLCMNTISKLSKS